MSAELNIYGIRHHGPGSARSLRAALEAWQPDCILVEGPPEADEALALAVHAEMKPPVALLVYDPESPQRSVYYPFAIFSPEWQAIQYGVTKQVPVRFMDLPQTIQMAVRKEEEEKLAEQQQAGATEAESEESRDEAEESPEDDTSEERAPKSEGEELRRDPLSYLAQAAGYSDSERWWEHMVEHRREGDDIFAAILEAMTALREAALTSSLQKLEPEREKQREAWMRQTIRAAQKEGFQRIAVVCGAWHAPALAKMPSIKEDTATLKGLPKIKVATTWIPWTHGRLAYTSGYGAGVESPGWYEFLWKLNNREKRSLTAQTVATHWMARVAKLLRGEDLDASSASVIEAVRLSEALAAIRGRPLPGLTELNEATQTVLCFGDELPVQLVREKLIIGERLGTVPDSTPMVPLMQDVTREQKRLRLPPEATQRVLELDLRKPNDLDRSRLLHRLNLLGVEWGKAERGTRRQQGTFHENWRLQWQPEYSVALIEAGIWGTTVATAAGAKVMRTALDAKELPPLTSLLDAVLLADLPEAAEQVMTRLQELAAVASDVMHLMGALPPLANILRYGNVRQTDATMVGQVVRGLVTRICIGLPAACGSLNDEAAEEMFRRILETHAAIALLRGPAESGDDQQAQWYGVLGQLAELPNLHGLIAGRATRLLLEARQLEEAEAARRFSLALSAANPPLQAAAWVDGFLRESGTLLLHDDALWLVIDDWVGALTEEHFTAVLPLLRRTFATFTPAERRQMGGRTIGGKTGRTKKPARPVEFDDERATRALPVVARLLGWADF